MRERRQHHQTDNRSNGGSDKRVAGLAQIHADYPRSKYKFRLMEWVAVVIDVNQPAAEPLKVFRAGCRPPWRARASQIGRSRAGDRIAGTA